MDDQAREVASEDDEYQLRQIFKAPFLRGSGGGGCAVLHSDLRDILPLLNRVSVCGKLAL